MATRPKTLPAPPAPRAMGTVIDDMHQQRESKRLLEAQVSDIEARLKELEEELFVLMDAQKTTKGAGKAASASITETVVANIVDWDKFHAYVRKENAFHLLQRRPTDAAVRELFQLGKKVPGAEPFTKRRINLRAL